MKPKTQGKLFVLDPDDRDGKLHRFKTYDDFAEFLYHWLEMKPKDAIYVCHNVWRAEEGVYEIHKVLITDDPDVIRMEELWHLRHYIWSDEILYIIAQFDDWARASDYCANLKKKFKFD